MTFNDFWHISEMPGVVIGDDMWNLIASLALRAVARSARYERRGIFPHSACRYKHFFWVVRMVSRSARCRFATMCRSLSELHDLPLNGEPLKNLFKKK